MTKKSLHSNMRIIHRYLGFFLAGIMAVYAISGVVLIFRDTDFLKQENHISQQVKPHATLEELGQLLEVRKLKVKEETEDFIIFENGSYEKSTGKAEFTVKELPYIIGRFTHIHKAKSGDPLFFLNIFFGVSLLFFVISSFWMFLPKTSIFKKGMYYTLGGIALTLLLLFI